jgi:uncharacterized protein (TIGR03382 family)
MKKLLIKLCLAVALFATPRASAEADSFGLGTGRDGALTVDRTTRINRSAAVIAPLAPGDVNIQVSGVEGFAAGDLVMVLQPTGLLPEPRLDGVAPLDLRQDAVGTFELARVQAASNTTLVLTAPLVHAYAASVTQVVRVPEYTSVAVTASGVLEAEPWNGQTGGVLAFLANQSVTNHGRIDASGAGFRGGEAASSGHDELGCEALDEAAPRGAKRGEGVASTRFGGTGRGNAANAGGGGVCLMSGGGGGGHGGAGGEGGRSSAELDRARSVGGLGGVKLEYGMLDHLTLGGGGGAGHVGILSTWHEEEGGSSGRGHHEHGRGHGYGHCKGKGNGHTGEECTPISGRGDDAGRGGGILFVRAGQLSGTGILAADGDKGGDGTHSGGSGGGAGGIIHARFTGSASCGALHANGGAGGHANTFTTHTGPGGGGGGGRILFQASSSSCSLSAIGGAAGVSIVGSTGSIHGAQPAQNGIIENLPGGFIVPQAPSIDAIHTEGCSLRPIITGSTVAGATVVILLDGQELARVKADASGRFSFIPQADLSKGTHLVQAFSELLGTRSGKSELRAFSIGCGPRPIPAPTVREPADGTLTNDSTPNITGIAEPRSTVIVLVDNNSLGTTRTRDDGVWTLTPAAGLADGKHQVSAIAITTEGSSPPATNHTFNVDTTPPDTRIVRGPMDQTYESSAAFDFNATEEEVSFECSIDDSAFGPCDSTFSRGGLVPGIHTFRVRATDRAGNVDPSPATREWTIARENPCDGNDGSNPLCAGGESGFQGGGCSTTSHGAPALSLLLLALALIGARKR